MRKPRLLLHVGAPKTGTTTLQHALHASRGPLLAAGILYPDVDLNPGPAPKHQWLANLLLFPEPGRFERNVAAVVEQAAATGAGRVVLSTEGLFNHWFDFSAADRTALARLRDLFDVTVWVVLREPVSWALSMYVQAVKNPPFPLAAPYATAESPEAIIDHAYFATRLRYDRFVRGAEDVFGAGALHAMRYESGDMLEQARAFLGVDATALASAGDRNRAVSALGVELLRRLNQLRIPGDERKRIAGEIVALDRTLGATSEPLRPSAEVRRKVLALSRESETYIERRFGIHWRDCRPADAR